jgi:hypothetical protein
MALEEHAHVSASLSTPNHKNGFGKGHSLPLEMLMPHIQIGVSTRLVATEVTRLTFSEPLERRKRLI